MLGQKCLPDFKILPPQMYYQPNQIDLENNLCEDITQKPMSIVLELFISKDIAYFEGHFPNTPVLPGVVQFHWAVYFAKEFLHAFEHVELASQIKFSNIIDADSNMHLYLEHITYSKTIKYTYSFNDIHYSSGRFKYV